MPSSRWFRGKSKGVKAHPPVKLTTSGMKLYEEPVYLQYDPARVVVGLDKQYRPIPKTGEVVRVSALRGSFRLLVEYAEEKEDVGFGKMLWLTGKMVRGT